MKISLIKIFIKLAIWVKKKMSKIYLNRFAPFSEGHSGGSVNVNFVSSVKFAGCFKLNIQTM